MKYLKTYESFRSIFGLGRTFKDFLNEIPLTSKIDYTNWEVINCAGEKLTSLKGIELLKYLKVLYCGTNELKSLKGVENCKELKEISCQVNKLENLKGIENLKNLEILNCAGNNLKNLDEVKNLPKLRKLESYSNPFDMPIPYDIVKKFGWNNIYGTTKMGWSYYDKFSDYEFQKMFLTKYPDRLKDLEFFIYAKGIKEEFPALFVGKAWGFFDLEGGSV